MKHVLTIISTLFIIYLVGTSILAHALLYGYRRLPRTEVKTCECLCPDEVISPDATIINGEVTNNG